MKYRLMQAQDAVNELCNYFLGEDWYDDSGALNVEQVNTNIVAAIEQKYNGIKTGRFKRKKFDNQHIWDICDSEGWEGCLISPPMSAQTAIYELSDYFLGDNYYKQLNAAIQKERNFIIVNEIKKRYKRRRIFI